MSCQEEPQITMSLKAFRELEERIAAANERKEASENWGLFAGSLKELVGSPSAEPEALAHDVYRELRRLRETDSQGLHSFMKLMRKALNIGCPPSNGDTELQDIGRHVVRLVARQQLESERQGKAVSLLEGPGQGEIQERVAALMKD